MYTFSQTVALDRDDRRVLDHVSVETGLPRDEVIRRAVRLVGALRYLTLDVLGVLPIDPDEGNIL